MNRLGCSDRQHTSVLPTPHGNIRQARCLESSGAQPRGVQAHRPGSGGCVWLWAKGVCAEPLENSGRL